MIDISEITELLIESGYHPYSDFESINKLYIKDGIEVWGIKNEQVFRDIIKILKEAFPQWLNIDTIISGKDGRFSVIISQ